eukprot:Sspe_Gene.8690::Locus_2938_Transcript_1_1_Confidence_1.000_Length_1556::g.8690::m.8690
MRHLPTWILPLIGVVAISMASLLRHTAPPTLSPVRVAEELSAPKAVIPSVSLAVPPALGAPRQECLPRRTPPPSIAVPQHHPPSDIPSLVSSLYTPEAPPVVLTYFACHGSASQHYSHLSAMVIAKAINASLVLLPHARNRNGYDRRNLVGDGVNKSEVLAWGEVPLASIYDVASFSTYMKPGHVRVVPYPPRAEVPLPANREGWRTHHLEDAVRKLHLPEGTPVIRIVYRRRRLLAEWKKKILDKIRGALKKRPKAVLVDLGCTDIMVGANPKFPSVEYDRRQLRLVHNSLRFNPALRAISDEVVKELRAEADGFETMHLRVEKDMFTDRSASRWWDAFQITYNMHPRPKPRPVFVASGIFSYMSPGEVATALAKYTTPVMYHMCVGDIPLDVRPWLDFSVLVQGESFFGHEWSSLTWLVIQDRTMLGRGLNTNTVVQKKGAPYRHPSCCETDRCLTFSCSPADGMEAWDMRREKRRDDDRASPIAAASDEEQLRALQ